QQLHMSEKYLSDKLKTISGKTAQEHIYLKLIEEAKVLLRQERLPIAKVAYQLGFEYPQYFSRFFKKRVGLTPKAYRVLS
ncbi:MAG: helix-turn-helix transcriptional regulator, partial [Bacteroidota bacterium]